MELVKTWIVKISECFLGKVRTYNFIQRSHGGFIHPSLEHSELKVSGKITVGENCKFMNGIVLGAGNKITIGRNTSLNGPGTNLLCKINEISIGSYCSIARGVDFQEYHHITNRPSTYYMLQNVFGTPGADIRSKGPITVGNDVWIGAQSVILSGVTIGHGAVVAANSVVNEDVAPYSIVGGSPAKVIGTRFSPEITEKLLKLEWWNWPADKIMRNEAFFKSEVSMASIDQIKA